MIKLSKNFKNELLPLIGIFSFLYPGILIIKFGLFTSKGLTVDLLIDFTLLFLGLFFSQVASFIKSKFVFMLPVLIILSGGLLKGFFDGYLKLLFEIVISLMFFFIGYRYKIKNNDNYFNTGRINFVYFLIGIPLIISFYFRNFMFLKPYLFIFTYLFIVIFILERNKYKLAWAFTQNGVDGSVFSTKIRSYNRSLSLILFLFIIVVSNVKALSRAIGHFLRFAGFIFIKFCIYLMMLINSLFTQTEKKAQPGQTPQMPKVVGSNKPSLIAVILDIVVFVLFLYALYKVFPLIYKKLKNGILLIAKFIKKLLSKFSLNRVENNNEYVDSMEILKIASIDKDKKSSKTKIKERNLKKIVDPTEKIRAIY